MSNQRVEIRSANKDDIPFVYSTWLRSYKHSSPVTRCIRSDAFYAGHQKILDSILSSEGVTVVIACDREDLNLIFGFLAYEPEIVHFVYIKKPFRKMGIAKKLLESQKIELNKCKTTHVTDEMLEMWTAGKTNIEYDPYLLTEAK